MSTLVAQTISNGTVSTSSANVIQGSAKAWVNFNGVGTVAIRASYNVSSITDNGTGDYTINFTNALADTNYSVAGTAALVGGTGRYISAPNGTNVVMTTTALRFTSNYDYNLVQDCEYISVQIFR
jgi:hypothetical protein